MKLAVIKTTEDASEAGHLQGHDEEVSRESPPPSSRCLAAGDSGLLLTRNMCKSSAVVMATNIRTSSADTREV
jgi:hypothetical protein